MHTWNQLDDRGVPRFDALGILFQNSSRATVKFLLNFAKLAGDVGCMAIHNRLVSSTDLTRVVQNNDLQAVQL